MIGGGSENAKEITALLSLRVERLPGPLIQDFCYESPSCGPGNHMHWRAPG